VQVDRFRLNRSQYLPFVIALKLPHFALKLGVSAIHGASPTWRSLDRIKSSIKISKNQYKQQNNRGKTIKMWPRHAYCCSRLSWSFVDVHYVVDGGHRLLSLFFRLLSALPTLITSGGETLGFSQWICITRAGKKIPNTAVAIDFAPGVLSGGKTESWRGLREVISIGGDSACEMDV
jgi:hypothetical protein